MPVLNALPVNRNYAVVIGNRLYYYIFGASDLILVNVEMSVKLSIHIAKVLDKLEGISDNESIGIITLPAGVDSLTDEE